MKNQVVFMMLLGLLICTARVYSSDQETLQDSLKTWQTLREQCKGNYSYKVRWSSFAGFGHETEVVVSDNKVAERRYKTFDNKPRLAKPGEPAKADEFKWVEKGKDVGKHKDAADAKTLDELYVQAAAVIKRALLGHERRYVRIDKQGLLLSCFTVDTRIADDAPTKGVIISSIALKLEGDAKPAKIFKAPNGKAFPANWGEPPRRQTRDLRPLPGGYGRGSGTLAKWIQMNLDLDAKKNDK